MPVFHNVSCYYVIFFDRFCFLMIRLSFTPTRDTRYTFRVNKKYPFCLLLSHSFILFTFFNIFNIIADCLKKLQQTMTTHSISWSFYYFIKFLFGLGGFMDTTGLYKEVFGGLTP